MTEFLLHLREASSSPAALAAYVVVVVAWVTRAWIAYRPARKAREILAMYGSDRERTRALTALLGVQPPVGLRAEDMLQWAALQSSHRSRQLLVLSYVATLLTALVIVGMALYRTQEPPQDKPPVLIDSSAQRPSS